MGGGKKKVLGVFSSFRRKRPSMTQPATPPTDSRSGPSNEVRLPVCCDDDNFSWTPFFLFTPRNRDALGGSVLCM